MLDEPFWLYFKDCSGIWNYSTHCWLSGCSSWERSWETVCNPVPSRSTSYSRRKDNAFQLRIRSLRMCGWLEDGCFRRKHDQRDPWESWRWKSITCLIRRSRLIRSSRVIIKSHRKTINMCICWPRIIKKRRRWRSRRCIWRKWTVRLKLHPCQCTAEILWQIKRSHRTRSKT